MVIKKGYQIVGVVLILSILLGCVDTNSDQKTKHISTVMRNIGHQILLSVGDSTSRVLPVTKINEHNYKIHFEQPFGFVPDSVVVIVSDIIKNSDLPQKYIVEVLNCETQSPIYSFEINPLESEGIIPCQMRVQPEDCYVISIQFYEPPNKSSVLYFILLACLITLLLTLVLIKKLRKKKTPSNGNVLVIGQYKLDVAGNSLSVGEKNVKLTNKEAMLLQLLAQSKNAVVERDTILKEVWKDEGTYVGRTLDVFISKLRKKLEHDEQIKITNVHGKGYKLELKK